MATMGVNSEFLTYLDCEILLFCVVKFALEFVYVVIYLEQKWAEENWEPGNSNLSAGKCCHKSEMT